LPASSALSSASRILLGLPDPSEGTAFLETSQITHPTTQCNIPVALYCMNIFALIKPLSNRSKIVWHYITGCAITEYLTESSIMLVTMSILILHMHP